MIKIGHNGHTDKPYSKTIKISNIKTSNNFKSIL